MRTNNSGVVTQSMKVPLAYGPKQKFLTRLREDPNLNKKVALTLPRMGFEISGISYDPSQIKFYSKNQKKLILHLKVKL